MPGWNSLSVASVIGDILEIVCLVLLGCGVTVELIAYFARDEARKHRLDFWAIILFFVPLVITEPLTYAYDRRVKGLAAETTQQQTQTITEQGQEVSRLKQGLQEAESASTAANQKLKDEELARAAAEKVRRTPPTLDAYLAPAGRGKVALEMKSENLIPFEYRYAIVTERDIIVTGIPMSMAKVYPKKDSPLSYLLLDLQLDRITNNYLEMRFTFESVYAEEFGLPAQTITRKYKLGADQVTLTPAQ